MRRARLRRLADLVALRAILPVGRLLLPRPSAELLERLARRDRPPRPRSPTLEEGRRLWRAGRYGDALFVFDRLVERDPEDAWAWHGRGDALQLLGDAAGALEAYGRAAELAPGTGLHHAGRANALAALGRAEEAEAAWAEALRLDPSLARMRRGGGAG